MNWRPKNGALLAALATVALVGCAAERPYDYYDYPPPPLGYYEYYYYPSVQVYYHPHRHVYWWHERGHWRSGRRVPPKVVLHDHVKVNVHSRKPWRHHNEVQRKYSSPAPPPPQMQAPPPKPPRSEGRRPERGPRQDRRERR